MDVPSMEISRAPMEWNAKKWDHDIFEVTKTLIKLRKKVKALQLGTFEPLKFKGKMILYRRQYNNENILVGINYSPTPKKA